MRFIMRTTTTNRLSATVCGACCALASCVQLHATIINIPGDQPAIQAGINAAVNGDTVLVAPGSYNETVDFLGKAITVKSSGGAAVTTISAGGLGMTSVIKFVSNEGADSILEGFTVTGETGSFVTSPSAQIRGGGVYAIGATPTLIRCDISGNQAHMALFGVKAYGGGVYHDGSEITLVDCRINGNIARAIDGPTAEGGGIYSTGSVIMNNCQVNDNTVNTASVAPIVEGRGGGVRCSGGTFINCEFRRNLVASRSSFGGGAFTQSSLLMNCLVANNTVTFGGGGNPLGGGCGISSSATLISCTVTDNTINFAFGSAVNASSLSNCIVFGNGGASEVAPNATVSKSCIEGGFAGSGNISADPLFVNASGGDFRLQDGSPCRDTGDRTLLLADIYDLDGDGNAGEQLSRDLALVRRIVNGQVDMGAYEWQRTCLTDISPSSPGIAGDGSTGIGDLLAVIAGWGACDQCNADVNNDDVVNIADLLAVIAGWGACQP
jgi:hypothetical protein